MSKEAQIADVPEMEKVNNDDAKKADAKRAEVKAFEVSTENLQELTVIIERAVGNKYLTQAVYSYINENFKPIF